MKIQGIKYFIVDSIEKIFTYRKFLIAFSGEIRIDNKFPETYLSGLDSNLVNSPLKLIIEYFKELRRNLDSVSYAKTKNKLIMIVSGYNYDQIPRICRYHSGVIDTSLNLATNHNFEKKVNLFSSKNFKQAQKIILEDIRNFVEENNLKYEIGGPNTIFLLTKNHYPKRINNTPFLHWKNWSEMKNYMKKNLNKLNPIKPYNRDDILKILKQVAIIILIQVNNLLIW
ncbi:MAG: hypothetical protein V9E90_02300 [Saprospiraceae bacterium]